MHTSPTSFELRISHKVSVIKSIILSVKIFRDCLDKSLISSYSEKRFSFPLSIKKLRIPLNEIEVMSIVTNEIDANLQRCNLPPPLRIKPAYPEVFRYKNCLSSYAARSIEVIAQLWPVRGDCLLTRTQCSHHIGLWVLQKLTKKIIQMYLFFHDKYVLLTFFDYHWSIICFIFG